MSRRDAERFADILDAVEAIRSHLQRGDLSDGLVYDAVRVRLIEIGEAVKSIPVEVVATEPGTPWRDIAAMRDTLAHRYFDTCTPSCRAPSRTTSPRSSRQCFASRPRRVPTRLRDLLRRLWAVTVRPQGVSAGQLRAVSSLQRLDVRGPTRRTAGLPRSRTSRAFGGDATGRSCVPQGPSAPMGMTLTPSGRW